MNSQKDNDRSPTETLGDDKEERSSFPKVVVGNLSCFFFDNNGSPTKFLGDDGEKDHLLNKRSS